MIVDVIKFSIVDVSHQFFPLRFYNEKKLVSPSMRVLDGNVNHPIKWCEECYESFKQMFFPNSLDYNVNYSFFTTLKKFGFVWVKFLLLGFFSYCCNCLGLYWVYILVWDVYICCVFILGVFVFWGVRDILNARAIYLQIEEAWA